MGPLIPHVWVNDPEFLNEEPGYEADAIVIQFQQDFLGCNFMEIPELEEFRTLLKLSQRGMAINGLARKQVNQMMEDMVGKNGLQRLSILLQIFDVLSHNKDFELLASPYAMQNVPLKTSDQFNRINEHIMRNFQEDIPLTEIASVANMAVTTFCNFFKHHYRVTFIEYLNTVKIGHACKLLAEDHLNIVEVAYKCGYNNLANFNKQFKKLKGMTPSEFRKQQNFSFSA